MINKIKNFIKNIFKRKEDIDKPLNEFFGLSKEEFSKLISEIVDKCNISISEERK